MDWQAVAREAEALLPLIAPHDVRWPVYVVLFSELPLSDATACGGWTSPTLDLQQRAVIGDRWRGRGFACCVDERMENVHPNLRVGAFFDCVLHEAAHAIAEGWHYTDEVRPEIIYQLARLAAEDVISGKIVETPATQPYRHHELPFIRTALHLAYRAELVGIQCGMFVVDFAHYGLSHAWRYWAAIGDEPERSVDLPLKETLRRPPPVALAELWAADVAYWKQTERKP